MKTFYSDNLIRIEDANKKAGMTLRINGKEASILSIRVDEAQRRRGVATQLFLQAETSALAAGCEMMTASFFSDNEEAAALFTSQGFYTEPVERIEGLSTKAMLRSGMVRKGLRMHLPGISWVPLGKMMKFQKQELVDQSISYGIELELDDMDSYNGVLSGVAYDVEYRPRSWIFCRPGEDEILVELLFGVSRKNPEFMMTVLASFAKALSEMGGEKAYGTITMISANAQLGPLLKRVLDPNVTLETRGQVVHAFKSPLQARIALSRPSKEEMKKDWKRELTDLPYQLNILRKQPWIDI